LSSFQIKNKKEICLSFLKKEKKEKKNMRKKKRNRRVMAQD
jgi:hypothetical protein